MEMIIEKQITHCKLVFIDSTSYRCARLFLVNSVIRIRLMTHRNNTILPTPTNVHEYIRFKVPCSLRIPSRFFLIQRDMPHLKAFKGPEG